MDLIGSAIRQIRIQKGISTYELAHKTGLAQSTISKLENGKRNADISILSKISKALDVDINEILRGPKTLREIYFDTIKKNNISIDELSIRTGLNKMELKEVLVLSDSYYLDDLYKVNKALGFSKSYILKAEFYDNLVRKNRNYEEMKAELEKTFEEWSNVETSNISLNNIPITDVKRAMEVILAQPGLMLNGEALSDESKIALANAIQMGLAYAEQKQREEKEKKNKSAK